MEVLAGYTLFAGTVLTILYTRPTVAMIIITTHWVGSAGIIAHTEDSLTESLTPKIEMVYTVNDTVPSLPNKIEE